MAKGKTKGDPVKKERPKTSPKVVPMEDINTAILRDVKEELTSD